MRLMPLQKRPERALRPLPPCEDTREATTGRRALPDHAGTFILDIQPPELGEINFCCLPATQSMVFDYLIMAAQMD